MEKRARKEQDSGRPFDARDRLILALYAQLKAERETREALEDAIRHGALSKEVLMAIAADPVPVITEKDIVDVEHLMDRGTSTARLDRRTKGE